MNEPALYSWVCLPRTAVPSGPFPLAQPSSPPSWISCPGILCTFVPDVLMAGNHCFPDAKLASLPSLWEHHILGTQWIQLPSQLPATQGKKNEFWYLSLMSFFFFFNLQEIWSMFTYVEAEKHQRIGIWKGANRLEGEMGDFESIP